MGQTIFLAVARHAKFEARIRQFRRAAGRAFVERLVVSPRLELETLAATGNLCALPKPLNRFRPEKDEKVRERDHQSQFSGERCSKKSEKKKCRYDPGNPFDFHRQDEEDVHDLVRAKAAAGEQNRRSQHDVRKRDSEDEGGYGGPNHPKEK